jgi:fructose-1,6-bisphosphatase/inositol monophosphatase family enzyme
VSNYANITKATVPLLQQAAEIAQSQRKTMTVDQKADASLVTTVDRAIEQFLKPLLLDLTPGAGFYGEEYGYTAPTDQGYWVLDPVDGTSNFAFHQPLWGITAAFIHQGRIQSGVIYLPDLNELFHATAGAGAFLNNQELAPIPAGIIAKTQLMGNTDSNLNGFGYTPGKMRHIGSFVVESTFVATQRFRALITGSIRLYDCAAGILINRELGADVKYLNGEDFIEANHLANDSCPPFYIGPKESNFPFKSF